MDLEKEGDVAVKDSTDATIAVTPSIKAAIFMLYMDIREGQGRSCGMVDVRRRETTENEKPSTKKLEER